MSVFKIRWVIKLNDTCTPDIICLYKLLMTYIWGSSMLNVGSWQGKVRQFNLSIVFK